MDYMQILLANDHPMCWMEAPDFDYEIAQHRFASFEKELQNTLKIAVRTESGELLQDAIYHTEAFLPVDDDPQPSIRFSSFGALVTIFLSEKVPESWQRAIENLLAKHGYVYIPAHVLAQPYEGIHKRFPDWFSRYFGA